MRVANRNASLLRHQLRQRENAPAATISQAFEPQGRSRLRIAHTPRTRLPSRAMLTLDAASRTPSPQDRRTDVDRGLRSAMEQGARGTGSAAARALVPFGDSTCDSSQVAPWARA